MNGDRDVLDRIERLQKMGYRISGPFNAARIPAGRERKYRAEIERLDERIMILTVALAHARTLGRLNNDRNLEVICDVALTEAGDEDYYND